MDPIDIFPIQSDKQTNFSSLIFIGELHIHFPLFFLFTIKELVILFFFGIPNPGEFLKSKS